MNVKLPVSVFIIAKDEADVIAAAVRSVVEWADEVLVVDSGSTDGTQAIAEASGAKVIFHEWQGFGQQKSFSEKQCRNDWLLNIDADEAVTPELAEEINALFSSSAPAAAAYAMRWQLVFGREQKPRPFAAGGWVTRLYNRRLAGFRDHSIHDSVITEGKVVKLSRVLTHRNYRSYSHWQKKMEKYSTMQAEDMFRKGRNPSVFRFIFEAPLAFIKNYIFRRYFMYGLDGYLLSWLYAHAKLARLMKLREIRIERSEYNNKP